MRHDLGEREATFGSVCTIKMLACYVLHLLSSEHCVLLVCAGTLLTQWMALSHTQMAATSVRHQVGTITLIARPCRGYPCTLFAMWPNRLAV